MHSGPIDPLESIECSHKEIPSVYRGHAEPLPTKHSTWRGGPAQLQMSTHVPEPEEGRSIDRDARLHGETMILPPLMIVETYSYDDKSQDH